MKLLGALRALPRLLGTILDALQRDVQTWKGKANEKDEEEKNNLHLFWGGGHK